MSNLSIFVVEDEPLYSNQLAILIEKMGYELAGSSDDGDQAYSEILNDKPDLLLVDININGSMDGVELVEKLNSNIKIPAIFITSYQDDTTFQRALKTMPHAYLSKPIDEQNLEKSIELAIMRYEHAQEDKHSSWNQDIALQGSFFIKNGHKLEKVQLNDILYLEVEDKYSTVYTEGNKKYVLRMSMANVQSKLPEDNFIRVHRKYSVNINKITAIDTQDNLLYLGNAYVPISRSHKEDLLTRLDWLQ